MLTAAVKGLPRLDRLVPVVEDLGRSDELENDWRRAITAIAVPMLQGAAVHTAMIAEELAENL
jgi:hypothetical protein